MFGEPHSIYGELCSLSDIISVLNVFIILFRENLIIPEFKQQDKKRKEKKIQVKTLNNRQIFSGCNCQKM